MGDQRVSEEMVKLIFTPLRESLTDTTNAIKESSNELRNLLETISKHPDKVDLKNNIDHLVETIKYDFTNKTQLLEVLISTKTKESTNEIVDKLNEHSDQILTNINRIEDIVTENGRNVDEIVETASKMFDFTSKIISKIDKLMYVVGITFTIAMIAWACLSYFFQVNLPTK